MKNNEDYDSISDILSPFTTLKNIDPDIVANAAKRGRVVHTLCTHLCEKIGYFPDEVEAMVRVFARNEEHAVKELAKVNGFMESFSKWLDKTNPKKVIIPEKIYNDYYMIKGIPDLIYLNQDDRWGLSDFKTPETKSKTWLLQLSAYAFLARKARFEVDFIEILQLDVKGNQAKVIPYEEDFTLFKGVLSTYRHFYKGIKVDSALEYT